MEPLAGGDPVQVAGYQLRARLGAGGMGRVYLAFTPGGRPVALKIVRPELGGDPGFRDRFRQEVAAARRVHGLYTAQVLDADPDAAPPWLVTAYVPGPSLQEAVTGHGPMPAGTVLLLMAGVAEALAAIHAAGVVHRDLKPSNVLLAPDGPRVIDFGIARAAESSGVTRTGMLVGSPQFMAPEQVDGAAAAPALDVFALGSLATYAALGHGPFGEGSDLALLYRVKHEPPDLAGCPAPLRDLIARCLAKDPGQRPTPSEIIAECRAHTAGQTVELAQSWLPPALAAMIAAHAPPPGPDTVVTGQAMGPGLAAAGATVPTVAPGGAASWHEMPPGAGATPVLTGRPGGPRRGRGAAVLAAIAAAAVAAGVLVAVLALRHAPGAEAGGQHPPASAASPGSASHGGRQQVGNSSPPPAGAGTPSPDSPGQGSTIPAPPGGGGTGDGGQPAWFAGTWIGSVYQPTGVVQHWTAELTLPARGSVGTFRLISLHCSGRLIITRAGRSTASLFDQVTRNERGTCVPGGLMKLTRTGPNRMVLAWQDSSDQNNVGTGHLTRDGGN